MMGSVVWDGDAADQTGTNRKWDSLCTDPTKRDGTGTRRPPGPSPIIPALFWDGGVTVWDPWDHQQLLKDRIPI